MRKYISHLVCLASASLACVVGTTAQAQPYSTAVQALNPAAYWPLQETVMPPTYYATNLGTLGASSYGQYGMWWQSEIGTTTVNGGTNYYFTNTIVHAGGAVGDAQAASLSMTSGVTGQYVVWPRNLPGTLITAPFSVEAWVYPANNSGSFQAIISQGRVVDVGAAPAFTDAASGFSLGQANGGPFFAIFNNNGSVQSEMDVTNAGYVNNTWHHLVATFDGANLALYIDGAIGTVQINGHCNANPAVPGTVGYVTNNAGDYYEPNYNDPLIIGGVLGSSLASTWQGRIAEVAIYNQALTPAKVAAHYAAGSGSGYPGVIQGDNPTIYARLNEPSVNTEFGIPNGTTLSAVAATSALPVAANLGTNGAVANGYYLPGSMPGLAGPQGAGFAATSYGVGMNGMYSGVDVGLGGNLTNISAINTNLNPAAGTKTPISAIAWFQTFPSDCRTRFQGIVGQGDAGWRMALDTAAQVHWNPGPGSEAQLSGFNGTAETIIGATNGFLPNDANWHMEAGVSDGTSNYLYLDGRLVIQVSMSSYSSTNRDIWLGGAPDYAYPGNNRTLAGSVSHVSFFTTALSASTVSNLYYTAGVAPFMTYQPQSMSIGAGYTAQILAWANGSGQLNYQWYSGTPGSGSPVGGATGNTLSTANAGSYYVVVTSAAGYGAVTSAVATLSVYPLPTTPYASALLALNPAGYWPLNETTPPPSEYFVARNSGTLGALANGYYETYFNSIDNTFYHTQTSYEPGVPALGGTGDGDTCLTTGSGGEYVVFPQYTNGVYNSSVTIQAPFSLECLIFPTGTGTGTLISKGGVTSEGVSSSAFTPVEKGFLFNRPTSNTVSLLLYNDDGTVQAQTGNSAVTAPITIGAWNHIVAAFDGTIEYIYVNGSLVGQRTFNSTQANASGQFYVADTIMPLLVGCGGGLNGNTGATGLLDEVAIYPTALTQGQVSTHYGAISNSYASTILGDNPSIYLRLDELAYGQPNPGPLPVATNYGFAGSWASGVYLPGTFPGAAGPTGVGFGGASATAMNGFNSAVECGAGALPPLFNPTGTGQYQTVMVWFKGNPADCINRYQNIIGHSDSSWRLTMDTTGINHFNPGPGTELSVSNTSLSPASGLIINDGNWHFTVGVLSNNVDYLYVDTVLAQTASVTASITGNPRDLFLGGDPQYLTAGSRVFDGSVAQAAYFTNALTQSQVIALYNAAQVPPYIVVQPVASAAFAGDTDTGINLLAKGSSVTYIWYSTPNGTYASGTPVSPAQNSEVLTFNPIQQSQQGYYFVVVSNSWGAVTSSIAQFNVLNPPLGSYAQQIMALGPIGYWPLNETGGTIAYDYSGNGLDGYYEGSDYQQGQGGPTGYGFGPSDQATAVNFGNEAQSSFIDIPVANENANLNLLGALTMMAWFQGPTPSTFTTFFGHSDSSYRMDYDASGQPHFAENGGSADDIWDVDTYGQWHFYVGVYAPNNYYYSGYAGSNYLYVDGVFEAANTHPTAPTGSALDVWIGGDPEYGIGRLSGGYICQCAIFSNALTALQVSNLYYASQGIASAISMPATFNANENTNGTLTATVSGGPPLAFWWSYSATGSDSNYISTGAATNALNSETLTISNVPVSHNGYIYSLYVTNAYGTASASSVLRVFAGPEVISVTPSNAILFVGYPQQFTVVANGALPLYYLWYTNGVASAGATASIFTTSTNLPAGAYNITVSVTNSVSSITSSPVVFTVIAPTNSYPLAVLRDHPVVFLPLNEGNPPATDNYPNDGLVAIDYCSGFDGFYTNADIGLSPGFDVLDPNTAAGFGVDGVNGAGINSYVGGVTGVNFAVPPTSPTNFSLEAWVCGNGSTAQVSGAAIISSGFGGGGEQFALDCGGTASGFRFYFRDASFASHTVNSAVDPLNSIWYHVVGVLNEVSNVEYLYINGLLVATTALSPGLGVQNPTTPVTIGARQPDQNVPYSLQFNGAIQNVAIYNYALSPAQVNAHFQAGQVPPLVSLPTNQFYIDQFGAGTLTAITNGTEPLAMQWYVINNSSVSNVMAGQTNVTLTLSNVQTAWQGYQYGLNVTNLYGSSNSGTATLYVNTGQVTLVGDLSPLYQQIPAGSPYAFTVTAIGTEPFTYVWYEDGQVIPGATSSTYSNLAGLGTNTFYVTVSNTYNSVVNGFVSSTATNVGIAGTPPLTFPSTGTTGWTVNAGTATVPSGSNVLGNGIFTPTFDIGTEARTVWYNTKEDISSFLCTFTYQDITPGTSGADGVTFTVQNDSLTVIGGGGGSFGYTAVTPSACFAINIYHGGTASAGLDADTIMFGVAGATPSTTPPMEAAAPVVPDGGDPINVTIYYNGTTATATLFDAVSNLTVSISTNINLVSNVGNPAYIGFTGADGGAAATQIIYNFSYATLTAPTVSATVFNGQVVVTWPISTSTLYGLQTATNLLGPWVNVTTGITGLGGNVQYTAPNTGAATFYRLQAAVP